MEFQLKLKSSNYQFNCLGRILEANQNILPEFANNFMSNNTYISPNLKRTSERINTNGDVINPDTKQIIKKIEPEYVEPTQNVETTAQPTVTEPPTQSSKIDEMINRKIEEIVAKKIEEALSKL